MYRFSIKSYNKSDIYQKGGEQFNMKAFQQIMRTQSAFDYGLGILKLWGAEAE